MNNIKSTLVLMALASSSAAFAATDFDTLDSDGNGVISQSEASVDANIMSQFKELDKDGSGTLTEAEFANAE